MGNGRLRPIGNRLTKTSYAGKQGGVISFMDGVALVTYVRSVLPPPPALRTLAIRDLPSARASHSVLLSQGILQSLTFVVAVRSWGRGLVSPTEFSILQGMSVGA